MWSMLKGKKKIGIRVISENGSYTHTHTHTHTYTHLKDISSLGVVIISFSNAN